MSSCCGNQQKIPVNTVFLWKSIPLIIIEKPKFMFFSSHLYFHILTVKGMVFYCTVRKDICVLIRSGKLIPYSHSKVKFCKLQWALVDSASWAWEYSSSIILSCLILYKNIHAIFLLSYFWTQLFFAIFHILKRKRERTNLTVFLPCHLNLLSSQIF